MSRKAENQLFRRLDESLKEHAAGIAGTPEIRDIYGLQDLAAAHHYLKAEHEFAPGEAEALLEFRDPLDVARRCMEENAHDDGFPICSLLQSIDAYRRFELAEGNTAVDERYARFREALAGNYFDYRRELLSWDKEQLIDRAGEIAAVTGTFWSLMSDYVPVMEEMDFFLQFEDPLHKISRFGPFDDIITAMEMLYDSREELMEEVSETPSMEPEGHAASVRERLQAAMRKVKDQAVSEKPSHDPGAR